MISLRLKRACAAVVAGLALAAPAPALAQSSVDSVAGGSSDAAYGLVA